MVFNYCSHFFIYIFNYGCMECFYVLMCVSQFFVVVVLLCDLNVNFFSYIFLNKKSYDVYVFRIVKFAALNISFVFLLLLFFLKITIHYVKYYSLIFVLLVYSYMFTVNLYVNCKCLKKEIISKCNTSIFPILLFVCFYCCYYSLSCFCFLC